MNEKLNHCSELAELLRTHLSERHSFTLEWGIIVLIAIEVGGALNKNLMIERQLTKKIHCK